MHSFAAVWPPPGVALPAPAEHWPSVPPYAQAYGRELDEAYDWCIKYKQSRKVRPTPPATPPATAPGKQPAAVHGDGLAWQHLGLAAVSVSTNHGPSRPQVDPAEHPSSPLQEAELHQAWDLYYHVFKRINKQLPSLTTLDLQYVAPALVRAQVRGAASGLARGRGLGGVLGRCTGWGGLLAPWPLL